MRKKLLITAAATALAVTTLTVPALAGQQSQPAPSANCTQAKPGQTLVACTSFQPGPVPKAQADKARNTLSRKVSPAAVPHPPRTSADRMPATGAKVRAPLRAPHSLKPGAPRNAAARVGSPVLNACLANATVPNWKIDRFDACQSGYFHVSYKRKISETTMIEVGHLVFFVLLYQNSKLDGAAWEITFELQKVSEWGETDGSWLTGSFNCSGACQVVFEDVISDSVDGPVDLVYQATISSTIFAANQAGYGVSIVNWDVNRPNVIPVNGSQSVSSAQVRCDSMFSNRTSGCVHPDSGPQRYILFANMFPEIAEDIVASQLDKIPGGDIALTRAQNAVDDNRATACPDSRPREAGFTCDEYPFASTLDGAASDWNHGETFTWCGIGDLPASPVNFQPAWSVCMVPEEENFLQGVDLGEFYADWRVIDGDEFTVEVD